LYYKSEENYSSISGGLITLLLATVFITYSMWVIVSVYQNPEWNLVEKFQDLSRAERDESGKII